MLCSLVIVTVFKFHARIFQNNPKNSQLATVYLDAKFSDGADNFKRNRAHPNNPIEIKHGYLAHIPIVWEFRNRLTKRQRVGDSEELCTTQGKLTDEITITLIEPHVFQKTRFLRAHQNCSTATFRALNETFQETFKLNSFHSTH